MSDREEVGRSGMTSMQSVNINWRTGMYLFVMALIISYEIKPPKKAAKGGKTELQVREKAGNNFCSCFLSSSVIVGLSIP